MNPSKFKNTSQFMPKQNFKFSSKLSSSQPELPIYTKQCSSNGQNNCKLNIIPEVTSSANEFKALNALDLRNKNFLSQVEWSEEAYPLKNIIKYSKNPCSLSSSSIPNSYENNFPILVKVVKGSYGIIKEASHSNSSISASKSVQNLLLYGKTKSIFILCQSIKFNKDKKPFVYGKNISIPITYNGWFEILSEDGKSIKPLTSIKELYNHWSNANNFKKLFQKRKNNLSYIVRENITAFIIPNSSCFYVVNSKNSFESSSNGEKLYSSIDLNDCKSVIIRAGDILQIDGEIYMQPSFDTPKHASTKKLIKCLVKRRLKLSNATAEAKSDTDTTKHAEVLYLPEDTLGRYSPVARIENISGVHKLADLVKKFRFPVTVQLVYGRAPPVTDINSSFSSSDSSVSFSNPNRFSPILKLLKIYEEENIFAYPVGKESCLIQIPTHVKLTMIKANNMGYLIENSSFLRSILNECKSLAPEYSDMINCLPKPPPQSILDGLDNLNTGIIQSCVKSLVGRAVLFENSSEADLKETSHNSLFHKKLNSSEDSNNNSCNNNNNNINNNSKKSDCPLLDGEDENKAYDEIDRLYEYVRTGILPESCAEKYPSVNKTSKEKVIKSLKKSDSLLKLCQTNEQPPLPQPIRIKISNQSDQLCPKNNGLKRQQSITHLIAANGLTKSKEDLKPRRKKETNLAQNNSDNSINNNGDKTNKELIDYYCAKTTSSQIKRSASLNKLDSFHSKTSHSKPNNQQSSKIPHVTKKHNLPKIVFPIVKHTKKVNFSGVNQYQQVLPPPPLIAKNVKVNKPIELKLSDLTELANIKAIVQNNSNKLNEELKKKQNGKSSKLPFNIYKNLDEHTFKTDYSATRHYNEPNSKIKSHNLRKNDYFDSLQTLNDYDLSSSNNNTNSNHKSNNNNDMYHSFAANDLLSSGEDENVYFGEEHDNYYMQKSQFAPFGNAKSNVDMTMILSNEKLNGISKKKVKIYARNEYANKKANLISSNINTHGLSNYSSMEKLQQIIRLQKY